MELNIGINRVEIEGMAAGQLWLFPPPKPLVERFGDEFFRALPSAPGVYFLCGETEGVLCVGKARNLRKLLSSYPDRMGGQDARTKIHPSTTGFVLKSR